MTEKIRVLHLLVKHAGSRRPSSWREENITRSETEALEILKGYHDQLAAIEDKEELKQQFKQLAAKYSDCSSAKRGGDLGYFEPRTMQAKFSEASLALQPYELSEAVSTDSGVHIILRLP